MSTKSVRRIEHVTATSLSFGIHCTATDQSMPVVALAIAAEERDFDSVFFPEHTHIPTSRSSVPPGGAFLDFYARLVDPYVAMAFVAAATTLKIGTCVSLVGQHDPVILAKTIATLDLLSNGRVVLGVGYGWNREEFENHGFKYSSRREVVREKVEMMRTLWRDAEAQYTGEHIQLPLSWSWPKPVQQPSVPVLIGCRGTERALREVAQWSDGWIPAGDDVGESLGKELKLLRRLWDEVGRNQVPRITVMQRRCDPDSLLRKLELFRELDVERVIFEVPPRGPDSVLRAMDFYRDVVTRP